MELSQTRTIQITFYLLFILALTQALFTGFYIAEFDVPRQFVWGVECVLFTIIAALAGAALVQAQSCQLGWSAIAFSAVLNVVQVSIGLTMFGPFSEAATELPALASSSGSVVALSFMIYYAAKLLLGLAALVFGMAEMTAGAKTLGGLTALVGVVAILSNAILIMFGRDGFLPSAAAGGSGVLATLLLALCLRSIARNGRGL